MFVVNVYSPCGLAEKRRLWAELSRIRDRFVNNLWYFVGDFNSVSSSSERQSLGDFSGRG